MSMSSDTTAARDAHTNPACRWINPAPWRRSGISTGAIARIELGQSSPAWVTVRQIAEALGVSLSELAAAVESER